jgi:hypothetical protein
MLERGAERVRHSRRSSLNLEDLSIQCVSLNSYSNICTSYEIMRDFDIGQNNPNIDVKKHLSIDRSSFKNSQ